MEDSAFSIVLLANGRCDGAGAGFANIILFDISVSTFLFGIKTEGRLS